MNLHPNCGLPIADCGLRPAMAGGRSRRLSGSVLIVVMWIAFGLVGMALYFAHAMEMNMRAADNVLASLQADQAIESAAIYYSNVLSYVIQINQQQAGLGQYMQPYMLPPTNYYQANGVKVGEARWWAIGRDTNATDFSRRSENPSFGLIDEASKANLNNNTLYGDPDDTTATNLLLGLPQMTINILSAIYDWETTNTTPAQNGAKNPTYSSLNPPYLCKMTNFDTVGELRMVYGVDMGILYREDANLNGALDPNENDGDRLPPTDNGDGILDCGFLEYFTVYTQEPTNIGTAANQTNRIVVSDLTDLTNFIGTNFPSVYNAISAKLRTMTAVSNVLDFILQSGITEQDFITIEPYLMTSSNTVGLINVNTANAVTLGCIPGIGWDSVLGFGSANAQSILNFRQSNPSRLNSVYWLIDAMQSLGTNAILAAGPWVTSHSWQYTADVAAVGHFGRGYRRVKFVFDCSGGVPQIVYRQDLTYLGWALGKKIHDQFLAGTLK
jgi:hypothetical protein